MPLSPSRSCFDITTLMLDSLLSMACPRSLPVAAVFEDVFESEMVLMPSALLQVLMATKVQLAV